MCAGLVNPFVWSESATFFGFGFPAADQLIVRNKGLLWPILWARK